MNAQIAAQTARTAEPIRAGTRFHAVGREWETFSREFAGAWLCLTTDRHYHGYWTTKDIRAALAKAGAL